MSYKMLKSFLIRIRTSKRLPETQPKVTDIASSCEVFNAQEGFVEVEVAGAQAERSSREEETTICTPLPSAVSQWSGCLPLPSRVSQWSLRKDVGVFLVGVFLVLFDAGFSMAFVDEAESLCTPEMGRFTPPLEWPSSPLFTPVASSRVAAGAPIVRNSAAFRPDEQNSTDRTLPSVLLGQFQNDSHSAKARPLLERCVTWTPSLVEDRVHGAAISELHAHLQCHSELMVTITTREGSFALLPRAHHLLKELHAREDTPVSVRESAQIEWARIIHGSFQLHCAAVTADLHQARRTKGLGLQTTTAAGPALSALTALQALQVPFQETLAALVAGIEVLKSKSTAGQELQVLLKALGSLRTCGLQALQEGRMVALALPPQTELVRKAKQCQPRMLEAFEDLVVKQAIAATDASSIFSLGLYFSDIGLAAAEGQQEALFFSIDPLSLTRDGLSESRWALDEERWHAPAELVKAEALMQTGELATADPDRSAQGSVRALRLYLHAKQLAIMQHDGASEWRYRAAAELAKSHERHKLAAHALARLGHLFSYRGRHAEALLVVQEALENGEEPLAQFLHVSLRRSFGELRSASDIQAAERMLSKVAGKLPSKALEAQRAAAIADLQWWRLSSTQGLRMCFQAGDAARFMICVLGNLLFDATEIASK